jgi:hypothetical protein
LSFPELRGECHFERKSDFFSAREGTTDVPVLGTGIERDQFISMLAVRLKSVADIPRSLSEKLRAFGAFDFYFIFGHEMALQEKWQSPGQSLRER